MEGITKLQAGRYYLFRGNSENIRGEIFKGKTA